jgi:hypothetical protein
VILVDTSVWVDHLREGLPGLSGALELGVVLTHPFIIGELALGNLRNRKEVLQLLDDLPPAPVAADDEVRALIEQRRLAGRGIGYVDAHLLAAVLLEGNATLWTRDKRLGDVAKALRVAHAD